ncbi:hypothetical protein, partial [Salmonella enterica]|uniref:hypothetical protein n=1 Tax=Salmonella enterica TaxID=28901 RepID=UPI00398C3A35
MFTRVLECRLPDGDDRSRPPDAGHTHRPGHELTCAVPKRVPLTAMPSCDQPPTAAHTNPSQHIFRTLPSPAPPPVTSAAS